MSQPLPDVSSTFWCFTVRHCLLQYALPQASLLEASLVDKDPPCLEGLTSGLGALRSVGLGKSHVLMCHAPSCMGLPRKWPTMSRSYGAGR